MATEPKNKVVVLMADPNSTDTTLVDTVLNKKQQQSTLRMASEKSNLEMNFLATLNGGKSSIERLVFESDPTSRNSYAAIYQAKLKLVPDAILKRIAIQDDLVAAIVQTRASQVMSFGRPQPDRFSMGFKLVVDKKKEEKLTSEEKATLQERISKAEKKLVTCGETSGWDLVDQMTLPTFLNLITRNGVTCGRLAVEAISHQGEDGKEKFHSFRPADAGTIYRATPFKNQQDKVRQQARKLLAQMKNERLTQQKFEAEEYAWVQVINGKPVQAFSEEELFVHTLYPVIDVELDGYPVTPIDQAINAISTHMNIGTHNKLYFQSGRATKGMLVVKSSDVTEQTLSRFKHQFQASINNVSNSWRMPVFAINPTDSIEWSPLGAGEGRDMEFQYLSDTNARTVMSSFQISPEELPGYQHLSRGTNNQALSESNNEYKLQAARDVGIRPLLSQIEDFMNQRIMPLIDPVLAKIVVLKFVGLDAETREKETTRLQGEQAVTGTYDSLMTATEQEPVGPKLGGTLPLNAIFSQKLDAYFTVGEIKEFFCGIKGAADPKTNPRDDYRRDPFFFNQVQMMMQEKQMEAQAQQQQAQQGGPPPDDQGGDQGGQPPQQQPQEGQQPQQQQQQGGDLSTGIDQLLGLLNKSETQLPASRRRLLGQQRQIVTKLISDFESDMDKASEEILSVARRALPEANRSET